MSKKSNKVLVFQVYNDGRDKWSIEPIEKEIKIVPGNVVKPKHKLIKRRPKKHKPLEETIVVKREV